MFLVAILCLLVGAVLGFRYRVFVLVPTTIGAWIIAGMLGAELGLGGWSMLVILVVIAVSGQVGFLCGISARWALASTRVVRRGYGWQPVETVRNGLSES